ncbi:gamma-glutamyl-gamma-aminobutyrate hydrolase family protein [Streptomyces sp. DH37]|uniref:gamma-glutamyl-gamma-aminobutyrate hydrolase family protein n=1 Tax=Streptomyces sp. DH37 TaxID=3040122 RepID=UPI002441F0E4|nr:gamma-glutamyl-gamma-aminobutyrate hydrolase family protein [Streptomyces sp. DH37]MDG9706009.1 gamma-glutamyl-gamma-aminobutyrate hydrolase family protein [Streptomyces sp. DH37]
MPAPLIGVSTYLEPSVRWGVWDQPAALLPTGYHRLVQRAGGLAALLPPDGAPGAAAAAVARLDGLVVAGGPDVEPVRYGARPHPRTGPPARERDAWELALIDAALAAGVPLLGVCRGMQLLNVALGGTLVQHLEGHTGPPGVFGTHTVTPVPGTELARVLGGEGPGEAVRAVAVPTYHHQAVGRLGRGLAVCARADDGTVEAVELPGAPAWTLGVQWHPEADDTGDLRVMRALVSAAERRAGRAASRAAPRTAPRTAPR